MVVLVGSLLPLQQLEEFPVVLVLMPVLAVVVGAVVLAVVPH